MDREDSINQFISEAIKISGGDRLCPAGGIDEDVGAASGSLDLGSCCAQ